MTRPTVRHRLGTLSTLSSAILRSPRRSWQMVRRALSDILDAEFEQRSPLPPLDPRTMQALGRFEVVLPPSQVMRPGNQGPDGLRFLVSLARALDVSTVFEIGTYNGATAWCLARNLPGCTVHTLDLPPGDRPRLDLLAGDEGNRQVFAEPVYEALPHEGRVVQEWGDSADFDFGAWARRVDLVYVDGAHSFSYVRSDSRNAAAMLAERGAIVWDDYWRRIPDVANAIHGMRDLDVRRVPGTRLAVHLSPAARAALSGAAADPDPSSRSSPRT